MSTYNKTIKGSSTYTDHNTVNCSDAIITVEETSTGVFDYINSTGTVHLKCIGSFVFGSTLVIKKLKCVDATISINTSSTITIKDFNNTGTVSIDVNDSSTLQIFAGSLNIIRGKVKNASTGVCRASIKSDQVETESASTWDAS